MQSVDLKKLSLDTVFHFIGIDGIGMSSIAEVLFKMGFKNVQGSNEVSGENLKHLQSLGVKVFVGHSASNVNGADFVIFSSAVPENNVEIQEAKRLDIPLIERASMLQSIFALKKSIAITGTHGKTTTTSFVGTMLDVAGFDATIVDGGIMNRYASNNKVGSGDYIVAEACEAFGNIKYYSTDIAVITNIDAEHMEYYHTFDNLKDYFKAFLDRVPADGLIVACADHPVALELALKERDAKKVLTYGFSESADVHAFNVRFDIDGSYFDVKCNDGEELKNLHIPLFGKHNVSNALVAVAIAKHLGVDVEKIRLGLREFTGTKHRFTRVADVNGITIFDDYAHHPREIETTLAMARGIAKGNKIFAIFQPHRYSRLTSLFDGFLECFENADYVVCMPVFGAGESEAGFKNHEDFYNAMVKKSNKKTFKINDFKDVSEIVLSNAKSGDIIVSLGAGSVKNMIYTLPGLLVNE